MSHKNFSPLLTFNNNIQSFRKKKTFFINKLTKDSKIPNIEQKTNALFKDPENFLKLPNETEFRCVVGQKPKGPRFNEKNKLIPYSIVGYFLTKDQKRLAYKTSGIQNNLRSSTRTFRKSMRLSKIKANQLGINESFMKRKNMSNITHTEIFDIFNNYKKRINKNISEKFDNDKKLCKDIPKIMHQYINESLSQQEKTLRNNEKYKNLIKRIENNIFKSLENKSKSKINFSESKYVGNNFYNTPNLIKNSGTEYILKMEKINSNEKKKNSPIVLNNHVQNWEMSLRRPKNFIGIRKEYLNIGTDNKPYWSILTEKSPYEEEKIIIPNIDHHINNLSNFKNFSYVNNEKSVESIKPLDLVTNSPIQNTKNTLEVKGKKLIDIEEKMANSLKGNIKIHDYKYERDFTKDLIFKINYSINKHSFDKN